MKDSKGIEIEEGDLVMVTIDTPVEFPALLVVFLEIETHVINITVEDGVETGRTTGSIDNLKYYPLSKEGLEVAKSDNNTNPTSLHREQKFIFSNIESKHLLIMDENNLRGHEANLYADILAEL